MQRRNPGKNIKPNPKENISKSKVKRKTIKFDKLIQKI